MAQVSGQGTVWNLPNYAGVLYCAGQLNQPFLRAIGGVSGGGQMTENFEFPIASEFDFPSAAQPAITETASLTAPTAIEYVRNQSFNVCQIFQESVNVSYEKLANRGRLSGINTVGLKNNVGEEMTWQKTQALQKMYRDINYTAINGVYQIATNAGVANKTRGMLAAISSNAVAASAATLTKSMIDTLLKTMFDNGAIFNNLVIVCNGFQKQKISDIYGYAPEDRTVGGVNIQQILTDFGAIGIMLDKDMPAASMAFVEMSVVSPVWQAVPGKGLLFYEDLAKVGASENGQFFGKFGLNYGAEWLHGKITGLATS